MLGFNHLLAGSIVAVIVPAPLVPVTAFALHFAMDMMPHAYGEEPPFSRFLKIQIAVDAVICVLTILFLLLLFPPRQWFIVGVGAFFCFLPDLLWIFWKKGPLWLDKILDFAHWIQWGERRNGFLFDAFYGFLMVFTLLALNSRV